MLVLMVPHLFLTLELGLKSKKVNLSLTRSQKLKMMDPKMTFQKALLAQRNAARKKQNESAGLWKQSNQRSQSWK